MKNNLYLIIVVIFSLFSIESYGGGACTPTTNGTCATSVALTPGAACVNGTTCGGGAPSGSSACIAGLGYECEWYSFTATATSLYVQLTMVTTSGCYNRSEVFSDGGGGGCGGLTSLSCLSGAPIDDVHLLTGLTIGNTYYIQNCYSPGGPCGNGGSFEACISVGEPDPVCNTCADPCGTAAGYASTPTVQQVVDDCTTSPFVPELQAGSTNTFCYDFLATNTSVDFNVIITSNCGGGNVTNFSWSLYTLGCGAPIQTGTLASLTFTGLTVGVGYVFCYTFDVPAGCTHAQHCPFFVGGVPLPIELTSFTADVVDNAFINLEWITKSEINNDYFTIEKSADGRLFEMVGIIDGAGNSTTINNYSMQDMNPYKGTSYYRLKQTDYDGEFKYSDMVAVEIANLFDDLTIFPNPVEGLAFLSFSSAISLTTVTSVSIYDISGRNVSSNDYLANKGNNKFVLETEELTQGMYFLTISNGLEVTTIKFVKN